MAKRNTRCCALCGNILEEEEWGERREGEAGIEHKNKAIILGREKT
jgi:hypothetical protein